LLPRVWVWSGENHSSNNGFQQFVTRFQTLEIASQDYRDPFILAYADARPIDIDLATADALPTFKDFSHYNDHSRPRRAASKNRVARVV
jgi:hypothetical protein